MSGWDLKSDILYAGNRCHVCKRPPWVLASTLSFELCKKPLSHLHLALVYRDCIVSERKCDIPDIHHTAHTAVRYADAQQRISFENGLVQSSFRLMLFRCHLCYV